MEFNFSTINDFRISAERYASLFDGDLAEVSYQVFRNVSRGDRCDQVILDVMSLEPAGETEGGLSIEVAWNPNSDQGDDYQINAYGLKREPIAHFWIPRRHQSNISSAMNVIAREIYARMDFAV